MMKYPFPFIGAGYGQYFEWFEMHIVFENVPDAKQAKTILQSVPEPIHSESADIKSDYLILSSGQFVNVYIQAAYGGEDDPEDFSEYEVSEEASDAFEEHLNRWLFEIHEICPILVAYRPEDAEAGGTDLSDWHDASGEMVRPILEFWIANNIIQKEPYDLIAMNALLYYFLDDPLAFKILENCLNEDLFLSLLQDEERQHLLQNKPTEMGLLKMLESSTFDSSSFGSEVILYAARTHSEELKSKLHEVLQKQTIENIEWLNRNWYNNYIVKEGFTKEIAEGYWMMMDALEASGKELTDLTIYNNMLAACSAEVHAGATEDRKKRAITIGEKYAANNPLMYWATFNLQCELGDFENALVSAQQYFKSNDPNKQFLTGELKKNEEYAAFRKTPEGERFVTNLTN